MLPIRFVKGLNKDKIPGKALGRNYIVKHY